MGDTMNLLKDSRVLAALAALAVSVAAYFGVDLPQNELTHLITAGDWPGVLSLALGVIIGALGGYGAAQARAKGKPDADSAN